MVSGKLPWEAVSTARDVLPLAAAVIPAPVHQECDDPPFDDWGSSELFTRSDDDPNDKRKSS